MVYQLFYEGVKNANWSTYAKLLFLGHVCTSKLSKKRELSFSRLNFPFELFPLSALRTLV